MTNTVESIIKAVKDEMEVTKVTVRVIRCLADKACMRVEEANIDQHREGFRFMAYPGLHGGKGFKTLMDLAVYLAKSILTFEELAAFADKVNVEKKVEEEKKEMVNTTDREKIESLSIRRNKQLTIVKQTVQALKRAETTDSFLDVAFWEAALKESKRIWIDINSQYQYYIGQQSKLCECSILAGKGDNIYMVADSAVSEMLDVCSEIISNINDEYEFKDVKKARLTRIKLANFDAKASGPYTPIIEAFAKETGLNW